MPKRASPLVQQIINERMIYISSPGDILLRLKISRKTLRNWTLSGLIGVAGRRVYLERVYIGQRAATSAEAIERFLSKINA